MKALVAWLTQLSPAHLIGIIALAVLLGLGIGPQESELLGLFGLVGLAIPTTSASAANG